MCFYLHPLGGAEICLIFYVDGNSAGLICVSPAKKEQPKPGPDLRAKVSILIDAVAAVRNLANERCTLAAVHRTPGWLKPCVTTLEIPTHLSRGAKLAVEVPVDPYHLGLASWT